MCHSIFCRLSNRRRRREQKMAAQRVAEAALILLVCISMFARAAGVSSAVDQLPTKAFRRTEHGTKLVTTGENATDAITTPANPTATAQTIDLALGLAMLSVPIAIVCIIHLFLSCRKLRMTLISRKPPRVHSPATSVTLDPSSMHMHTTPPPLRRVKSKSVAWQSPFETKGRRSHRNTSNLHAMATSDLHFVMVATPERPTESRQSNCDPMEQRFNRLNSGEDSIPRYRLDRLDSSPREEEDTVLPQHATRISHSPVPMLEDLGGYDSDSPRISVSSAISDDPEIAKLFDAVQWTCGTSEAPNLARVVRSSSSLDDFRHDLHHENDQDDPDQITRSSEYSF